MDLPNNDNDSNSCDDYDVAVVISVPAIAIEWTLLYSVTSDVEVARISNVCLKWRQITKAFLLQQGAGRDPQTQQRLRLVLLQHQHQQQQQPNNNNRLQVVVKEEKGERDDEHEHLFLPPLLLLASMIQNIFLSHDQHEQQQQQQHISTAAVLQLQPPPVKGRNNPQRPTGGRLESFCVAWFAPQGIRHVHLDLSSLRHSHHHGNDNDDNDDNDDDNGQRRLLQQQEEEQLQQQQSAETSSVAYYDDLGGGDTAAGGFCFSASKQFQKPSSSSSSSQQQPKPQPPFPITPSPTKAAISIPPPPAVPTATTTATTSATTSATVDDSTTAADGKSSSATQTAAAAAAAAASGPSVELVVTAAATLLKSESPVAPCNNEHDHHEKLNSSEPRIPSTTGDYEEGGASSIAAAAAAAATTVSTGTFGPVQVSTITSTITSMRMQQSHVKSLPSSQHKQQSPTVAAPAIEQTRRQQQQQQQGEAQTNNKNTELAPVPSTLVTDEWRGYHRPIQVLRHFGYTQSFVEDVLQTATGQAAALAVAATTSSTPRNNNNDDNVNDTFSYQTTCAVRGAIIARPESYCLCLQQQEEKENCHDDDLSAEIKHAATSSSSSRQWADIRLQEHKQALLRRHYRRHQLKLNVLPRVVLSSPCKDILNPTALSSSSSSSSDRNNNNNNSRRQYSVQFLNAPGNHAVCMMTPPFACGPIPEPVTIFCIAIATEDGCFLSGLHHRFELGHGYPDTALSEITEQSPVCVATEGWNENNKASSPTSTSYYCPAVYIPSKTIAAAAAASKSSLSNNATTGATLDDGGGSRGRARTSSDRSLPFKLSSSLGDDSSSMDNSDDSAASSEIKCECIFRGVSEKNVVMDADEAMIRRGNLGPGSWHCYVAVFDGDATRIRIDGVEEEIQSDDTCVPVSIRGTPLEKLRHAMLDGLTIGSDHCFGMSLCCGQGGKRGEGEGAIAELAVFHGRFDQLDINVLEQTLMDKHGIVPRGGSSSSNTNNEEAAFYWQENEFHRRAHCLYSQGSQPHQIRQEMRAKGQGHAIRYDYPRQDKYPDPHVPLRCMARHDAVAWKQYDPVTGEPRQIAKIGSRLGGSSSDW